MMEGEGDRWRVAWSTQMPRTACIAHAEDSALVACGTEVVCLDGEGVLRWRRNFPFHVYQLQVDSASVALLCGHGFHLLNLTNGTPLHDGRATPGGFTSIIPRPSGGWVLADRVGHLHLFNARGIGIRRLNSGEVRRLVGWLDREHLLLHSSDGRLRCLRLVQEDLSRAVDDSTWSWVSMLHNGHLLLQATDGEIWTGVPHPFGWDSLDRLETIGMEPVAATRSGDGWWFVEMDGTMVRLPPQESTGRMDGGDYLSGNGIDVMVSCTRDGLLRWWESPSLALQRRTITQRIITEERQRLDWDQRKRMFESARLAEDDGMLSKAVEFYQALGRTDDVKRILKRQSRGD